MRCADGDLKLPGGGVHEGEPDEEALRRELAAETGASVLDVTGPYGAVWLDVDVALDRLRSARTRRPPWRARELLVLEQLAAGR